MLFLFALFTLSGILVFWAIAFKKELNVKHGSLFTLYWLRNGTTHKLKQWENKGVKVAKLKTHPFAAPIVVVLDPTIAEEILRRPEDFPQNPKSLTTGEVSPLFDHSIVHLSGVAWKDKRKPLEKLFNAETMLQYGKIAKIQFSVLCQEILASNPKINFAVAKGYVLRVLGLAIFNFKFADFDGSKFSDHEVISSESSKLRTFVTEKIGLLRNKKLLDSIHSLKNFVNQLVIENLTESSSSIIGVMVKNDFTDLEIVSNTILFLLAGHHTTASLILWTLFELSRNPHCLQQYSLPAILNEVQRLHPVFPIMATRITGSSKYIGGVNFEAKSPIILPLHFLHNSKQWHEPDVFNPDRDFGQKFFYPFAHPKRQCMGKSFAILVASTFIEELCKIFNLSYNGAQEPKDTTDIELVLEKCK